VAGRIDVVISPLTITSRRMEKYDFSQQYISSGLSVAVPARNAINFDTASKIIKETLFSSTVAAAVIGFLSFNLVMAALIRWILFSPNDHHAGGRFGVWMRAILEALMRTIGLRGVDGEYKSALSKLFEIFMAVVGTALSATILGILTSAFVGSVGDQEEIKANKLVSMRVATLHCSTAQDLLHSQYVTFARALSLDNPATDLVNDRVSAMSCVRSDGDQSIPTFDPIPGINGEVHLVDSWPAAMELLAQGRVDAVLGDWVALTYLSRQGFGGKIDVLPNVYRNEPYGWGISRTSVNEEIRRDIDSALINNMRDVTWRRKLEGALGAGSVSPN
jgi:ABC-type amino acid transport substrate-binding protein